MLVFDRKEGEPSYIEVPPSDEWTRIEVTPITLTESRVRLGFEAPRKVSIIRHDAKCCEPQRGEYDRNEVRGQEP